jgi:transposase-like protein
MENKNTTAVISAVKIKVIELYLLGYAANRIAAFLNIEHSYASRAVAEYINSNECIIVESKMNYE